jgi:hypothetical protein
MKNKFMLIAILGCLEATAQVRGSFEQIYYYDEHGGFAMGPVAQFQTKKNWAAEARYNYEEARTVSFYVGRVYEHQGRFSYSITPLFGGVIGRFNGGSTGVNMDIEYNNFYFSSQSQYTFSIEDEMDNFYFSWSELGYQPLHWFYGGIVIQETYFPQVREHITHPGIVVGFCYKSWTLPIYGFRTGKSSNGFICSIIYEW